MLDAGATTDVTIRDSLLLELRLWVIFVDNHFINFDGLIFTGVGGVRSFGNQFVCTGGDAVVGANANPSAEKTDTALGGFDIAMNRGIEIIWGVNGRFLFGLAEVLRGSTNMTVWIFFFPVGHILILMFPVITMSIW